MKLKMVGKNRVGFEAIEPGGMKTLAYSRPTKDQFNIDIGVLPIASMTLL